MAFVKGRSGNPKGRPKDSHDVTTLAKKHTVEAVERLVMWMRSDNPKASVAATQAILDRGHGRPAQPLIGDKAAPLVIQIVEPVN